MDAHKPWESLHDPIERVWTIIDDLIWLIEIRGWLLSLHELIPSHQLKCNNATARYCPPVQYHLEPASCIPTMPSGSRSGHFSLESLKGDTYLNMVSSSYNIARYIASRSSGLNSTLAFSTKTPVIIFITWVQHGFETSTDQTDCQNACISTKILTPSVKKRR